MVFPPILFFPQQYAFFFLPFSSLSGWLAHKLSIISSVTIFIFLLLGFLNEFDSRQDSNLQYIIAHLDIASAGHLKCHNRGLKVGLKKSLRREVLLNERDLSLHINEFVLQIKLSKYFHTCVITKFFQGGHCVLSFKQNASCWCISAVSAHPFLDLKK